MKRFAVVLIILITLLGCYPTAQAMPQLTKYVKDMPYYTERPTTPNMTSMLVDGVVTVSIEGSSGKEKVMVDYYKSDGESRNIDLSWNDEKKAFVSNIILPDDTLIPKVYIVSPITKDTNGCKVKTGFIYSDGKIANTYIDYTSPEGIMTEVRWAMNTISYSHDHPAKNESIEVYYENGIIDQYLIRYGEMYAYYDRYGRVIVATTNNANGDTCIWRTESGDWYNQSTLQVDTSIPAFSLRDYPAIFKLPYAGDDDCSATPGDADNDGAIGMNDALAILQYAAGVGNTVNIDGADVNADQKVDAQDALMILQRCAGWNVELK